MHRYYRTLIHTVLTAIFQHKPVRMLGIKSNGESPSEIENKSENGY